MNPFRTLSATSVLELFVFLGTATTLIPEHTQRLSVRLKLNKCLAKLLAHSISLQIEVTRAPSESRSKRGRLLLANHLSVLDVIALASIEEGVFITSKDMGENPIIGAIAKISGTLLIERRHRGERIAELHAISELLREGRTVILFPEATSGNGEGILRFRNGLLAAALAIPRVEITPICLQYESLGGFPIETRNRDRVFLSGDLSVAKHLWRILTNPAVKLKVSYLETFSAQGCGSAHEIAERSENAVREVFRPVSV